MGKFKDVALLENMIFDSVEYLEKTLKLANGQSNPNLKIRYQSGLAALDLLNAEYRQLTGKEFIDQNKVLQYHSKQWEKF